MQGNIVVVDLGGQYAHLIANRVRRLGAFSELVLPDVPLESISSAAGIILSGSGASVGDLNEQGARKTHPNPKLLDLGIPVLGLCYGHQWLSAELGGQVAPAQYKEYGETLVHLDNSCSLFSFLKDSSSLKLWMSHSDEVVSIPPNFKTVGHTHNCRHAAIANEEKKIYGLQFHPEVTHSERGQDILGAFVNLCHPRKWEVSNFIEHISPIIREQVGDRKVFMLVSGGVDSTVAFTVLNKVLGVSRVSGLLVDTGLMRKDEISEIQKAFKELNVTNLMVEDASQLFLDSLKEVYEPEKKRIIIGQLFLNIKDNVSTRLQLNPQEWILGQGTIYPDTIETGGTKHSSKIKTHHNRIDQITELIKKGLVVEPLKELYKDEVRAVGRLLDLPAHLVDRHPFPGPGLGVRILCVDEQEQFKEAHHLEGQIESFLEESFQTLTSPRKLSTIVKILPVKSVGVQGDNRSYKHSAIVFLRESPKKESKVAFLSSDEVRILNDVTHRFLEINRVLVCVSHDETRFKSICHSKHPSNDQSVRHFQFLVKEKSYLSSNRVQLLREVDGVVTNDLRSLNLYSEIWQFPVVLLPISTRADAESIVLRPVSSMEAMTARAFIVSEGELRVLVDSIVTHELLGKKNGGDLPEVDFVFYDATTKPPATIEFE